ncbi:MAG: hypothetical protein KFW07_01585 [Mycoplasmataceae bacterium]|nr:hypothetical protein [Mycoplasmataceae bacterium]
MFVFLDTTQSEFVACLFDENYQVIKQIIKKTKYKVEEITNFFNILLIEHKLDISKINLFYINIGPGSFTGSRISLIYVRTIAQITGAKVWITNSFKLLENNTNSNLFIFSNKNHSFKIELKNIDVLSKTELVVKSDNESSINYDNLLKNFNSNLHLFSEKDLMDIKPEYGSMPQIGNIK